MKSLKLVDYLPRSKDKAFKLVGIFPDGEEWIKEFTLNTNFGTDEDPENPTEVFLTLCEIVETLNEMKIGDTIYHQMERDHENYKSVIMRIE